MSPHAILSKGEPTPDIVRISKTSTQLQFLPLRKLFIRSIRTITYLALSGTSLTRATHTPVIADDDWGRYTESFNSRGRQVYSAAHTSVSSLVEMYQSKPYEDTMS